MDQKINLCAEHYQQAKYLLLPLTIFKQSEVYCNQCNHFKNKAILQGDK